jgi:crotonobetainyl-CoA:carnitine CoA-transferase CaiB-like acyl-CoA transferase
MPALDGLRVLDVTQVMAGPFCATLLADLGADVIKVEPPSGDSTRQMPGAIAGDSPSFNAVNRGKRSVVLNLKTSGGRDAFVRLARSTDIVIENYRPGVMAALGLDYPTLSALNPRVIYASISGYGQTGRCADGFITLGAANERLFRRLCDVLGHTEWITMPEFADNASRVRHREALAARIESITAEQPRSHWLALLEANDIPCGPINDYAQVFADPQVRAREMVVEVDHPTLGRLRTLGSPLKMSGTPPDVRRRAPLLGEHTDAVLREAGFSDEEIAAMREAGAIT